MSNKAGKSTYAPLLGQTSPINVAARLEQAAAPGEILAGERTVSAAWGAFEFDEPSTVEAREKPQALPAEGTSGRSR